MSSSHIAALKENVSRFPDSPGVYLMKNKRGRVIYVGKAKRLSSRVRNYVQKPDALDPKTDALMRSTESIDYIATDSEVEALVLECTLIKEYRPRYNIRLKDDKRYPFIKLTTNEQFPRLFIARRVENDGAEYFGPYTDAKAVRSTLKTIRTIFPVRDCSGSHLRTGKTRECLNFHMGRCRAPCTGRISEGEYREIVDEVRLFLRGRSGRLNESLRERMWRYSREKKYEEAAAVRDQIRSLDKVSERQLAVSPGGRDEDIVALARERNLSSGVVMKVREGRILDSASFLMPAAHEIEDEIVFEAFFELYYHRASDIPPRISVMVPLSEHDLLCDWLRAKTGRSVRIVVPRSGKSAKLMKLALKNATLRILSGTRAAASGGPVLRELKRVLGLASTPLRIEAYDISNIQGSEAVGSLVTFENAKPLKTGYRHFRIREVDRVDDVAMMREVIERRFSRLKEGRERRPDLIIVDGGKGQVSCARKTMDRMEIAGIPIIGLAKRNEEIYLEARDEPIRLPRRSTSLRLLQRVRDEAHRFAVEYHRKLRSRRLKQSELEDIPGIGEKRKIALLMRFGSLEALRKASREEIASTPGVGGAIAERIFEHLHRG
jgi:excinuclease ABC subunit C